MSAILQQLLHARPSSSRLVLVRRSITTVISLLERRKITPGCLVPGKVVLESVDERCFQFSDLQDTTCTVTVSNPQLLQDYLKRANENNGLALYEPMYDIHHETGNHVLHVSQPLQPWSPPSTVKEWNALAFESNFPFHCAQQAWDLVPRIRRRMAVVLTNLSMITQHTKREDAAEQIAAIWYAGAATILDPTVEIAWEHLLTGLTSDKLELHIAARWILEHQVPKNMNSEALDGFRNSLRRYENFSEDDNFPKCWSHLWPPKPISAIDMMPRIAHADMSDINNKERTIPRTPDEFKRLRASAQLHFREKRYDEAKEDILQEWRGLQPRASDLAVTAFIFSQQQHQIISTQYGLTSLVLDAHNAKAWTTWWAWFQTTNQVHITSEMLHELMQKLPTPNAVLTCRQELHRLKELMYRPESPYPMPEFQRKTTEQPKQKPEDIEQYIARAETSNKRLQHLIHMVQNEHPEITKLKHLSLRRVPQIHKELNPVAIGLNQHIVIRYLYRGYLNACGHPWQLSLLLLTRGQFPDMEDHGIQRWRGLDRYLIAKQQQQNWEPGDVLPSVIPLSYPATVRSMYRNTPCHPSAFMYEGSVHVSVGFNDLGELLTYEKRQEGEKKGPVRFIGVDKSPFAVARSLILLEMLQDDNTDLASVMEVWYSTVWTTKTLASFTRACDTVSAKNNDLSILEYVEHWLKVKPQAAAIGRHRWWDQLETWPDQGFGRKAMLQYLTTGELILQTEETNEEDLRGSFTFLHLPIKESMMIDRVTIFSAVPFASIIADTKNNPQQNVMECIIHRHLRQLAELREYLKSGDYEVDLRLGEVSFEGNDNLLEALLEANPRTVSWSNVCDYVTTPDMFHAVAAKFKNAKHFGYSMNWTASTFGTDISDYLEHKEEDAGHENGPIRPEESIGNEKANRILTEALEPRDHPLLEIPTYETPMNVSSTFLARRVQKSWVDYFFSSVSNTAEVGAIDNMPDYNPLSRSNNVIFMTWHYREHENKTGE